MDEDFGDDAAFVAAVNAVERNYTPKPISATARQQSQPQPQAQARPATTIGARPAAASSSSSATGPPKVQQPKPQVIPGARSGPSSILVSPRQKGNPILNNVRSLPWEYSDIPADYVLGGTTCALFLSLKYHRLHPEYVYSRIRQLGHKYNLRILLTMVDITNHEESLKELSKTSLVNDLTLILCWSAAEAGRYLELFKSCEHTAPTSIRAAQATSYADKVVEFVTVPRSINKTDALGLVSSFGSVRAGVNARPEELSLMAGWGEAKVQRWTSAVRENFRVKRTARRTAGTGVDGSVAGLSRETSRRDYMPTTSREDSLFEETEDVLDRASITPAASVTPARTPIPIGTVPARHSAATAAAVRSSQSGSATPNILPLPSAAAAGGGRGGGGSSTANPAKPPAHTSEMDHFADDEEALLAASEMQPAPPSSSSSSSHHRNKRTDEPPLSEGIMAALAKFRQEK